MGGGGGQNTVTQKEIPEWVTREGENNYHSATAVADRPYQQYTGQRVAGLGQDSIDAANAVRDMQGTGAAQIGNALNYTYSAGNYNPSQIGLGAGPQQITAGNYQPQMIDGSYTPQQISAGAGPQQINAGNIASGMAAYQNPYEDQVVQSGLQALNVQRLQGLNQTADQARSAGAFGGSRHGVMEASLNAQAATAAGNLAATTRAQGFQQALGAAESDRNAALTAQQANQSAGLQYGQQSLAAQQANQSAGLNAAQLGVQAASQNQQAGLSAAQLALQGQSANASNQLTYGQQSLAAQQANQSAGLNAAQMRLNAGSQIGALAGQQNQLTAQELGLLDTSGQQQRAVDQGNLDVNYQNWLDNYNYAQTQQNAKSAALGLAPYSTTTNTQQSGTSGNVAGQVIGGTVALGGLASAVMSDPDTKKDIEKIGEEDGVGVYSWRYKGEPETHPRSMGLMADEVARKFPEAAVNAAGVRGINPAALPPSLASLAQGGAPRPDSVTPVSRSLSQQMAAKTKAKGKRS